MNKKLTVSLTAAIAAAISAGAFNVSADTIDVVINDDTFTDYKFKDYVQNNFDTDNDGFLSQTEINAVTKIDVSDKDISSLKGIEYFTNLTALYCDDNRIPSLDVSSNTCLEILSCSNNELTSLDLSSCNSLTSFNGSNQSFLIGKVDSSYDLLYLPSDFKSEKASDWQGAVCENGVLTNISANNITYNYDCGNNYTMNVTLKVTSYTNPDDGAVEINETSFPDETFRNYVNTLAGGDNKLSQTESDAVTTISVSDTGISDLTGIEHFANLDTLHCSGNNLKSLDLSQNKALTYVQCNNNQLTSLNVSGCTSLQWLHCHSNQLTSLDLTSCTSLSTFDADSQTYSIGNVEGSYDLSNLPTGFVPVNAKDWQGASCDENGVLTSFSANDITYTYDCGNSNTMSVTLHADSYTNPDDGAVEINETSFPDETFRNYVKTLAADDSKLSKDELSAVTDIDVANMGISSLKGIEHFTALKKLYCGTNSITSLDLSHNTALTELGCSKNSLSELDVSHNTALTYLECNDNSLTKLDVSSNTALTTLNCSFNDKLSSLNVSGNDKLESLSCQNCLLAELDLSNNTSLTTLQCYQNQLIKLNVSNNKALASLFCDNNQLSELDVRSNTALSTLRCNDNQLSSLDVSNNTSLISLTCSKNQLSKLDISNNIKLKQLHCNDNELTSLDLSNNTALTMLNCANNHLTSLDAKSTVSYFIRDNQTYSIGDVQGMYYLSELPGSFDPTRASNWTGAEYDETAKALKNFTSKLVTYTYNCGNDSSGNSRTMTVTLAADSYTNTDEVEINTANFPDSTFRTYVKTLDTDNSGKLSKDEINAVTKIDVSNKGIADLKGIEYFTELTQLECNGNELTSLDVSKNTALTKLICYSNQITKLDVSKNTALTNLSCSQNQLTSLNVSTALIYLDCYINQLTSLDVSGSTALTKLSCNDNQLETLNISGCTSLEEIYCDENRLTSLDVSGSTALITLRCRDNKLTSLYVSGCTALNALWCDNNQLTSLDLTSCTGLKSFSLYNQKYYIEGNTGSYPLSSLPAGFDSARASNWSGAEYDSDTNVLYNFRTGTVTYTYDCGNGRTMDVTLADSNFEVPINETNFPDPIFRQYVKELANGSDVLSRSVMDSVDQIDVSYKDISSLKGIEYFAALKTLKCYNNKLTSLDVSSNTKLVELRCSSNQISSLKLNREIENLSCNFNQLTSLDLSGFDYLTSLEIASNQLTSLKLKDCGWLETLILPANQLTSLDLSDCTGLISLDCESNKLTSLDLTGCTDLEKLNCSMNQLTSLDVSGLKYLNNLNCSYNQLTSLSVRNLNMLTALNCSYNQLTGLDVYGCTQLTTLKCFDNQLTSLDVYNCTALKTFDASNQTYPIAEVVDTYPLTNLPEGFEAQYAADWSGAEYDEAAKALKNFTANSVTYNYDCGNNYKMNVTLSIGAFRSADDVAINEKNFPDPVFRKYVSDTFDTNGNGYLSKDEIAAVTKIEVYNKDIYDLTGVEYFTDIELLNCANDKVTKLDVSRNTKLKELALPNNQLTSLDISNNTELIKLNCYNNKLTALDLSNNTKLEELYCGSNRLTELDVSKNTELTRLDCYTNKLTALDVSNNAKLKILNFDNNHIAELDVSKNTALTWLECSENLLASLNLSQNTALTILGCNDNRLTSLDLSNNTALTSTYLAGNSFDIGEVTKTYDLANLPAGFDSSRASNWQGAVCENGVLTGFTANTITYTYNCGNGISETFTLTATLKPADPDQPETDPIADFAERLYTTLLGRPSDEKGKAEWVADLKNGRPAADVASGFVLSEELANQNLSNSEFVDRMYRTLLGREADEAGKAEWVSTLDSGCSYGYILNSFAGSQEFNNLCGSYGITAGTYESTEPRDQNSDLTAFVSRMYTKALDRAYDVKGLNDWTNDYLTGAATAEKIAYGFIFSPEFVNKELPDENYVDVLYRTFFDREADAEGRADWLNEMADGASREDVLNGFLGSQEFANLKAGFNV